MIEYRAVAEMRADKENLSGLVTPFDTWTTIGDKKRGGFDECIAPGTFAKTLQERDVVLIHDHNTGLPMARTSIPSGYGSLSLRESARTGLEAEAKPVPTSYAKDVLLCADAGVIRGMSFGFEVIKDDWTDDEGRASNAQVGTKRTIREVRLHEVTTTAFPAYPTTQLAARDAVNAARGVEGARAAKASYADLDTCGECGSESEYGAYCGACGTAMASKPDDGDTYCTSCGAELDDSSRSAHLCATRGDKPGDTILDAAAMLLSAYNALPEDQRAAFRAAIESRDEEQTDSADSESDEAGSATSDEEDRSLLDRLDMANWAEALKDKE